MGFEELIKKRHSVRNFRNTEIEKEKLARILEVGRMAPSAVNRQPWHFIVISEKTQRQNLNRVFFKTGFYDAPVVIAVCADHNLSWHRNSDGKDHADIDAAIAADHMILMATELGLGSCWVCSFDLNAAREILELPDNIEPIILITLGYRLDDNIPEKIRKNPDEIIHYENYPQSLNIKH